MFTNMLKDLKVFMQLPNFGKLFFNTQDKKELLIQLIKRDYADIDMPKKKDKTNSHTYNKAQQKIGDLRNLIQKIMGEAYEVIEKLCSES